MKNYTFFEVLEPINGITGTGDKQDVIRLLETGEIVLMVGKGIVSPKLPIGTMHMLAHKPLLDQKGLKVIEDKEMIKESIEAFDDIIKEVEKETTAAFLEMIEIHSAFIKIPKKLRGYVEKTIGIKG